MTKLGMVTISSMPDPANHLLLQGFKPYAKLLARGLTAPLKTLKSINDFRLMANIYEIYQAGRWMELQDMRGKVRRSVGERILNKISDSAGYLFGLTFWDHGWKSIATMATGHKIIELGRKKTLSKYDQSFLADMRLSEDELREIVTEFENNGRRSHNGVQFPQAADWDNQSLARKFGQVIRFAAQRMQNIPTPGTKPLWMTGENSTLGQIGKHMGQFQQFVYGFLEKMAIPTLQDLTIEKLSAFAVGVSLGIMSYVMREVLKGKELDEVLDEDPKKLLLEGIDRAGYTMIMSKGNSFLENATGGQLGLGPLFGVGPLSKSFHDRDPKFDELRWISDIGGPSVNTLRDLGLAGYGTYNYFFSPENLRRSHFYAGKRLIPLQNSLYLRNFIEQQMEARADEMGVYR